MPDSVSFETYFNIREQQKKKYFMLLFFFFNFASFFRLRKNQQIFLGHSFVVFFIAIFPII